MLRRVALARTDVSEERSASIIRVTRISELGTLAVTSNRRTRMMEALRFSETSVLTRVTRRNISEDGILLKNTVGEIKETAKQAFKVGQSTHIQKEQTIQLNIYFFSALNSLEHYLQSASLQLY
jgi:hypothetical protein